MSNPIPKPPHFEALTDAELEQFGTRYSAEKLLARGSEEETRSLLDDMDALKDNYRRLRQHHILETEWLWAELERVRPGITRTLRKPPS